MKKLDLINQKYNLLTVIKFHHKNEKGINYWLCKCDCGKETIVSTGNLRQNQVKSCGCLYKNNGKIFRDNLIGKKFNMLTVIDSTYNKEKQSMIWICKCDCGSNKKVEIQGHELKSGKIKSCGCFRRNRLSYGENSFNRLYDTYRRRAKNKSLPFELDKSEFRNITKMNCFYCGIEPYQVAGPTGKGYGEYIYNGIDKVDPSKGYNLDNVVPCCGQCNVAKNNHSQENFYNWIKRLHNNLKL